MSMRFTIDYRNTFRLNSDQNLPVTNEDGIPIRKIHVKGFRSTISQSELQGLFEKFGTIENCRLAYVDGMPIYAFITFADCGSARKALSSKVFHQRKKMIISPADTWHQPKDCKANNKDKKSQAKENDDSKDKDSKTKENNAEEIGGSSSSTSDKTMCQQQDEACSSSTDDYTMVDILNHDCIMKIFSYLSIRELIYSERVSKKWRALVNDKLQGLRVFKTSEWAHEKSPLTTNSLRTLLIRFGASLRKLHLDYEWSMLNQRTPQIISKFCPNLTDLLVSRISTKNWATLLENCYNLKSLSLSSCEEVQDRHFKNMKCKLEEMTLTHNSTLTGQFLQYVDGDSLKKLSLNKCYGLSIKHLIKYFPNFTNLRKLSLDYFSSYQSAKLDSILELVPNLTEFSFCNIDNALGKNAVAIAKLKELEVLLLSKNRCVNNEALKIISKSCPKLTTLDISVRRSFRSDVTNEGVNHLWKLPNLQVLGMGDLGISDAAFDKIGIYEGGSKLKTLVCRHNDELTNAGLLKVVQMCPDIRKIDAYGCHKVNEEFIQAASDAMMLHPHRTEKLVLYIVHAAMYTEKSQEVIKSLKCPLIQVEINEEFCDPLLHSYKVCCEYSHFSEDDDDILDDIDDDDDDDFDDYDNFSDPYEFGYGWGDEDSLDGDFCFHGLDDEAAAHIVGAFFFQPR